MLGTITGLIFTIALSFMAIQWFKTRYAFLDASMLIRLYFFHFLLTLAYYGYAAFNFSDSLGYYTRVAARGLDKGWLDYYGTSTIFIEFVGYPFIRFLGFNYEGMMLLFAFFGFLGFCFFYVFVRENIRFNHDFYGINLAVLVFFLPNLHFWSASYGKGSIIFLGIAMYFYGISKLNSRFLAVILGSLIIYHVRPHIFLVVLMASLAGFVFSAKRVSMAQRVLFLGFASVVLTFIFNDVMSLVGLEDEMLTESTNLDHRASKLTKATSGIDIQNYNFVEKMFAFIYRPLFFDAPGLLGLIVSFENLFYLIITFKLFNMKGLQFLVKGDFMAKTAIISFFLVSFALAQVSGNLGLAMRQKSQVMPLFMFYILYFLDQQKVTEYRRQWTAWQRKKRAATVNSEQ